MKLIDKNEATNQLAEIVATQKSLNLYVSEDICFAKENGEGWVSLGKVDFYPNSNADESQQVRYDEKCAIRFGGFEWSIPKEVALDDSIKKALPDDITPDHFSKIKKAFREGYQDVIRRTLLCMPVFDADTISMLPLERPTTIVPDTSAVHQGALNFVCRFLTPLARVKVPAIVHMEILTNVDNYFKIRFGSGWNKNSQRSKALSQHLLSQGGQRTLLRMELTPDLELDRGDLGADPLRGIVTPWSDSEDKSLGLQNVTRSFADRLIVETARRFQFDVRPDHPLFVLTSDQGMARMAMAEGLGVFFFQARSVPKVEETTLTGALYHPFSERMYTVSFVDVLWELAVSFGRVRISNADSGAAIELWGIVRDSERVTWQPLHAKEDLLWASFEPDESPRAAPISSDKIKDSDEKPKTKPKALIRKASDLSGSYKFSPNKMFSLIGRVVEKGHISREEAKNTINVKVWDTYFKYERFLRSGGLVLEEREDLLKTNILVDLWEALRTTDTDKFRTILMSVPSFSKLFQLVQRRGVASYDDPEIPTSKTALPIYLALGEAACAWLRVVDRGIVFTPNVPGDEEFARMAINIYQNLREKDKTEWVLTGKWIEYLAIEKGIHPLTAKRLLPIARDNKYLQVFAEGSTPDTRFDDHSFWVITEKDGRPHMEQKYLYRGDFLLPGISAVRIKLQDVNHAS
ncbi:MAG: hypothetical protein JRJ11_12425 [Deltaproteobacteria bacterium]|nr:hypothetical protein [Deltaproteobacteria bacterium]MBW1910328.1 hypothetical protein [Deltaproteobacteria bacterium]MBW2034561.1 hypothetical protein [Deltaproteobacteria bacterium]MBW2115231.1 hypothetical protein [Deltaproteobacteria bacterium]